MLSTNRRWILAGAGAALAAFLITAISAPLLDSGRAEDIPGSVPQAGSTAANGVTVAVERAVFSGTGSDVWLRVSIADPAQRLFGVPPIEASLDGRPATSALIGRTGLVVLRFPALDSGGRRSLTIGSVEVGTDGGPDSIARVVGPWTLPVRLPTESALAAALQIESFKPVSIIIAGEQAIIDGVRTARATVIRYDLPRLAEVGMSPYLKAGDRILSPLRVEQQGTRVEAWFDPTERGSSVVVAFNGVKAAPRARFDIEIAPFDAPKVLGEETIERVLTWKVQDGAAPGATPTSVVWRGTIHGRRLTIEVDGIFAPEPNAKPQVFGDGKELFVGGVGIRPATATRGEWTDVEAHLPEDGTMPRLVTLSFPGSSIGDIPSAEAVLSP